MARDTVWEDSVEQTCLRLSPPLLLSSLDSWNHPQGSSEEDRRDAGRRIAVVQQWVDGQVPLLLSRLQELLEERQQGGLAEVDVKVKACIAIATAAYVSPRKGARRRDDEAALFQSSREPWITTTNARMAVEILEHPLLCHAGAQAPDAVCLEAALVRHLLVAFIKPLFSATGSQKVNPSTGRASRGNANLASGVAETSSGALLDEEIAWKGGDVERCAKIPLAGSTVVHSVEGCDELLYSRHRALGCCNVLSACCSSIQALCKEGTTTWDEYWPLVLPALLTLLEDPSPLYRLIGTRILTTTLLSTGSTGPQTGTLLLRTGVVPLFRQVLESSLTYISTKLSAALIESASEALVRLAQVTTVDMYPSSPQTFQPFKQDGGRDRFEQLSKLIDEGILQVWAYAPSSLAALEAEEAASHLSLADGEDDSKEASDVVDASINLLTRLTQDDVLGVGVARYLDLMLEFLTGQLIGLEARLDRHGKADQGRISLKREVCSARAMAALLKVCKEAPGLRSWSSRCLDAVVRSWTLLQGQRERGEVQELAAHLHGILGALVDAQPDLMRRQLQKVADLDADTFMPLVGSLLQMG